MLLKVSAAQGRGAVQQALAKVKAEDNDIGVIPTKEKAEVT